MSSWETQLRKGLVDLAVLATIARGETYGYRIVEQLRGLRGWSSRRVRSTRC